jgi:hypothetical protein
MKAGLTVGILVLIILLIPFGIIGGTWGTIWYYLAAPLSVLAEQWPGIGQDSPILVLIVSVAVSTMWAIIGGMILQAIQGMRSK